MKRFAPVLLLLALTACNKQPAPSIAPADSPGTGTDTPGQPDAAAKKKQADELVGQMAVLMNGLADSLEKAKDEPEAVAKAREFNQALGALDAKVILLDLLRDDTVEIHTKHDAEIKAAQDRAVKAAEKYPKVPAIAFAPTERPPAPLHAGDKEVKPVQQWTGGGEDFAVLKPLGGGQSGVITDAKKFGEAWSALRPGEKQPELDFSKVFVIYYWGLAAHVKIDIHLRDKDDLYRSNEGWGLGESGFRYVLMAINRDGINSINHSPLPK